MKTRRSVILSIRVSPIESLRLQATAAQAGQTMSAYVRSCLTGRPAQRSNALAVHDLAQLAVALDRLEQHEMADRVREILAEAQG